MACRVHFLLVYRLKYIDRIARYWQARSAYDEFAKLVGKYAWNIPPYENMLLAPFETYCMELLKCVNFEAATILYCNTIYKNDNYLAAHHLKDS